MTWTARLIRRVLLGDTWHRHFKPFPAIKKSHVDICRQRQRQRFRTGYYDEAGRSRDDVCEQVGDKETGKGTTFLLIKPVRATNGESQPARCYTPSNGYQMAVHSCDTPPSSCSIGGPFFLSASARWPSTSQERAFSRDRLPPPPQLSMKIPYAHICARNQPV